MDEEIMPDLVLVMMLIFNAWIIADYVFVIRPNMKHNKDTDYE